MFPVDVYILESALLNIWLDLHKDSDWELSSIASSNPPHLSTLSER